MPIRVRVEVAGEEMTIDLSDVSAQVRGFYNSGQTTGIGCTQVAYKCLTSPTDYPVNDGAFRSLKSIVPAGKVVSAVRPAPMRKWMTYPMTVIDTVFKALAPAIPDRVIAGHHADLLTPNQHGVNPKTKEFFIASMGPVGGGWGAKHNEDEISATVCINDGDTHNSPCEQTEAKFPLVIERFALIPDSGGAGKFRGGLGIERVLRTEAPLLVNCQVDRVQCKPWGLAGGHEASGNELALRHRGKWSEDYANAKMIFELKGGGDAYRVRSGGGGGYGPPHERAVAAVANDVRQGYVTRDAAAEIYGVILDPETFAVDEAATAKRREELRREA